jgi:hypothetical protein
MSLQQTSIDDYDTGPEPELEPIEGQDVLTIKQWRFWPGGSDE